ncbi:MAG: aspartate kinase [Candidatus Altiarchaeota archaeon]
MVVVMKFGGTSVGDGKRIFDAANIVKRQRGSKVVVLSAMGGVTDKLINIAKEVVDLPTSVVEREVDIFYRDILIQHRSAIEEAIQDRRVHGEVLQELIRLLDQLKVALLGVGYLEDLTPKSLDYIMSFGERLSVLIMTGCLKSIDIKAEALTGYEAGLITDSNFGCARPLHKISKKTMNGKLKPMLSRGVTPVVTGFVAGNQSAKITTLGRGGSDFTASLVGNYINADEVQIWTDVDGILTTDPKAVKNAKLIKELSYVEAMDLAYYGAKVIHSKMIEPAMVADIPVVVKNTFNPRYQGTRIVRQQKAVKGVIKAIAISKNVAIINLQGVGMAETPGIAGKVFSLLGEGNINILMISGSSESNLSFVVSQKDVTRSIEILKDNFQGNGIRNIGLMGDVCIITVVGAGMQGTKGVASKVFESVAKANVNIIMIAQGSSEVNIAFIVNEKDAKKALNALHRRFIR